LIKIFAFNLFLKANMNTFAKIMLIPVVIDHSHGGHGGHSSHSTHKSYNPRHVATSVIATYLIFGHFSDGVENLFYINENYNTYNITYYVKQLDEGTKECIYYIVSENFNNESNIDASNMKIVENVSYIDDYGYDLHEFCRTLDNGYYRMCMLIGVILVMIVVCCCINCVIGSDNYSNRSLY
jgi:hypothetical protein|tara:strand:+ start:369 stop:914 length:546 start_codon:yes stop_codon:yes gene_type:complete